MSARSRELFHLLIFRCLRWDRLKEGLTGLVCHANLRSPRRIQRSSHESLQWYNECFAVV